MRKCNVCGREWSDKVYPLHRCSPLTKRDLMVKILSEKEGFEEKELKKLKKDDLLSIANQ